MLAEVFLLLVVLEKNNQNKPHICLTEKGAYPLSCHTMVQITEGKANSFSNASVTLRSKDPTHQIYLPQLSSSLSSSQSA